MYSTYNEYKTTTMSTQNNTPTKNIFDNMDDVSDEEVTHWRVFDCAWELNAKRGQIGDYWDNHEDFDTLEEATAEFKDRCKLYKDTHNDEVDAVYLEEMGGGEEEAYPIDTVEYWERISQDEYKKLHSFVDNIGKAALNFDDIEESIRQIEIAAKAVYDAGDGEDEEDEYPADHPSWTHKWCDGCKSHNTKGEWVGCEDCDK